MEFNEVVQPGQEVFDYARCQRPDGSYYGTSGTCRKGSQVGPKEKAALKKAAKAGNQKAKVALAVVEGKMTKAEAKKELGGGGGGGEAPKAKEQPKKVESKSDAKPSKKEGYEPKAKPEEKKRNVLQRAKDKITGKGKNNIEDVGFKDQSEIKKSFERRRKQIANVDDAAKRKKMNADLDKQEAAAMKAHGNNKKFASDLKNELPRNVKTSINEENGAIVMTSKIGKDKIEAEFSPTTGWNYTVNGGYATGTVTDRKQQVRIASQVRQMYDATVRAAPEGQVFNTSAYSQDGNGASRERAYQRLGFSKPDGNNTMYAVKRNGKMVPSGKPEVDSDQPLRFAEDSQDQIWMDIVFPSDKEKKE